MKNKGFTLVELLAVILILGLIALIAIPQVIKTITNSEEESIELSIQNYVRAVEVAVMNKDLDVDAKNLNGEYKIIDNGKKIQSSNNTIDIDFDGEDLTQGKVTIKDYKVISLGIEQDNKYIIYESDKIVYNGEKKSPDSFTEDDWDVIALNIKVGNTDKYVLGAEREIKLQGFENSAPDSNGLYTVRIANKSTDECTGKVTSETACGFVIEFVDVITTTKMNETATNKGGYPASSMYSFLNDEDKNNSIKSIYERLPQEIKSVIKETKVISSHGSEDTSNFESTDKIYLLSTKEVWGKEGTSNVINNDTAEEETRQLDYYEQEGVTTEDGTYEKVIKYFWTDPGDFWLRSAQSDNTTAFYRVSTNGGWYTPNASGYNGVAPAFRIG